MLGDVRHIVLRALWYIYELREITSRIQCRYTRLCLVRSSFLGCWVSALRDPFFNRPFQKRVCIGLSKEYHKIHDLHWRKETVLKGKKCHVLTALIFFFFKWTSRRRGFAVSRRYGERSESCRRGALERPEPQLPSEERHHRFIIVSRFDTRESEVLSCVFF